MDYPLFVIEASGKKPLLQRLLRECGIGNAKVLATLGHLCGNPSRLTPLAIAANYRETQYAVKKEKASLAQQITDMAIHAQSIWLATDDDAEGDVIARDVFQHCIPAEKQSIVKRLRLRALTKEEVQRALAQAKPLEPLEACQGDARRVVDRLLGSLSGEQGVVGRVSSSALLALAQAKPVLGERTYTCASADKKGVWVATEPVYDKTLQKDGAHIADVALSAGWENTSRITDSVMDYNDILLKASVETGMALRDINAALQHLYENGALTYLRSRDHAISPEAIDRLSVAAEANGVHFRADIFPDTATRSAAQQYRYAHEAPNPLSVGYPLNRQDDLLSRDDRVLVFIARQLLYCGIVCKEQKPAPMELAKLPPELQGLAWHRQIVPADSFLWDRPAVTAGTVRWTPEQALLHFMTEKGLGRASTILSHVESLLSKSVIEPHSLSLTEEGMRWRNHAATVFNHKIVSPLVESLIEASYEDPASIVAKALRVCGLSGDDFSGLETVSDDAELDNKEIVL
jgi:DNA topoisomerase-1